MLFKISFQETLLRVYSHHWVCKYIFNSATAHLGPLCFAFLKTSARTFHWAALLRSYWRTAEILVSSEPTRCPNLSPVAASFSHCRGELQCFGTATVQPITRCLPVAWDWRCATAVSAGKTAINCLQFETANILDKEWGKKRASVTLDFLCIFLIV